MAGKVSFEVGFLYFSFELMALIGILAKIAVVFGRFETDAAGLKQKSVAAESRFD